jgi:hypothetical protein
MGEDDFNELMPSFLNGALKRTDMFSNEQERDNYKAMLTALQTEQGMKNYAESNGLSLDQAKRNVKKSVNSVIEKSLQNEYLERTGSYEWDSEKREYVPAILDRKRSVSEAPFEEEEEIGFGFGDDVSKDINEFFRDFVTEKQKGVNYLTSEGMKIGSTVGPEFAPNMTALLKNKVYQNNPISKVEYNFTGYFNKTSGETILKQNLYNRLSEEDKAGFEPRIELTVFTDTGEKDVPGSPIDLSSNDQIRNFLNQIGEGAYGKGQDTRIKIRELQQGAQQAVEIVEGVFGGVYERYLEEALRTGRPQAGMSELQRKQLTKHLANQ